MFYFEHEVCLVAKDCIVKQVVACQLVLLSQHKQRFLLDGLEEVDALVFDNFREQHKLV